MSRPRVSRSQSENSSAPSVNNSTVTKGETQMSQNQETPVKPEATTPAPVEIKKTYKYFDLSTFEDKSEDVTITFQPPATLQDAMSRVGDQSNVLTALTNYLREAALDAAAQTVKEKGVPKKVALDFIKVWRNVPPYSKTVTTEKGKDPAWKKQYNDQTKQIMQFVASNETMLNGLRAFAAEQIATGADTSEEEE